MPADPAPVTVSQGQATTLDLGGGADLIIPPGAMTPGAKVSATYQGTPNGTWADMSPTSSPVKLISDPPDAIHGLLTLEFPVPAGSVPQGIDPADAFGISTYDADADSWIPVATTYDVARHMVVTQIPHFSWWNPFSWDFTQLWANVTQGFGAFVGTRAGAAKCDNTGTPNWVSQLVGISNGADLPIHACVQSQGDVLDIQIQNNRPYGQVLTYGGPVKWGWHQDPDSAAEAVEYGIVDPTMTSGELYIPPLGRASVGILKQSPATYTTWKITPTTLTVTADLFTYLAGPVITLGMPVDARCASLIVAQPLTGVTADSLRNPLVSLGDCLQAGFLKQVASGALDSKPVTALAARLASLKAASVVGTALSIGGVVWRISDLVADHIADAGDPLLNGFGVMSRTQQASAPPASTQPPAATKPPAPTPPAQATTAPAQAHDPVNAYDNYGSGAVGHAMCRGNPGNARSVPGGTATQTFTVPQRVAALTGAMIQIDPAPEVTAQLAVIVDGTTVASATAAAAGDTRFSFGPVAVRTGQAVTLRVTFGATGGKIITVYTVGDPGGTFTASNSCPDGAPSVTVSPAGLRAVVYGTT